MVLPTPAADDQLRPETTWIEPILRTLGLSRGGVLIHVDNAEPERLGELARALLARWPDLDVLAGVEGLETAPEGSTRVLAPRVEEALWLNLNRPIVTRRGLRIVLWCDRATTVELSRKAPDFFDWISLHVECPPGPVPHAVAGIRAALKAGVQGIHWTAGGDEATRRRAFRLLGTASPGLAVHWVEVDVEGPYEDLVGKVAGVHGEGLWVATAVAEDWKLWRFRWACAEAKLESRRLIFSPGLECPGFWPLHDRILPLAEAVQRLSNAGAGRPGLTAALVSLEPEAVDFIATILESRVSEEEVVSTVVAAVDPGAALVSWASQHTDRPIPDLRWPMVARCGGFAPTWQHPGLQVEETLHRIPRGSQWFELASKAFELGDSGAAASWAPRELSLSPGTEQEAKEIARRISTGSFETAAYEMKQVRLKLAIRHLRETAIPLYARELVQAAEQSGVATRSFAEAIVSLATAYVWAGVADAAVPLLAKVLGLTDDKCAPALFQEAAPNALPFLDDVQAGELKPFIQRFFAARPATLTAEHANAARAALITALRFEGRHEEADLLAKADSTSKPPAGHGPPASPTSD